MTQYEQALHLLNVMQNNLDEARLLIEDLLDEHLIETEKKYNSDYTD